MKYFTYFKKMNNQYKKDKIKNIEYKVIFKSSIIIFFEFLKGNGSLIKKNIDELEHFIKFIELHKIKVDNEIIKLITFYIENKYNKKYYDIFNEAIVEFRKNKILRKELQNLLDNIVVYFNDKIYK